MSRSTAAEKLKAATSKRQKIAELWQKKRNNDVSTLLATCLPVLYDIDRFGLFVLNAATQELWIETGTGVTQRSIVVNVEGSLVGEAIRNRETILKSDLSKEKGAFVHIGEKVGYTPKSALVAPIFCPTTGNAIGALQLMNSFKSIAWTDNDRMLLQQICHGISQTVEVLNQFQEFVEEIDELDKEIKTLDKQETAIRGGHMLRTFEPAIPLHGSGFLHGRHGNVAFPTFIDIKAYADLAQSWDTDEHDIFICTHQKVGTHLAKKFVAELLREGLESKPNFYSSGDIGHGTMPWPEVAVSQHGRAFIDEHIAKTHNTPRAWYIHCSYEEIPVRSIHPNSKFVVVYRDPKAVAVSQYFFWKRHPLLDVPEDLSLDSFVELFLEGDLYFGDYHNHVNSWINRKDPRISNNKLLILSYEDMVNRKIDVARALSKFLLPTITLSETKLKKIANSTEFKKMKDEVSKNPQSFHLNPKVYFRSGTTNDWKQKLSDAAIAAIDEKSRIKWNGQTNGPAISNDAMTLDDLI